MGGAGGGRLVYAATVPVISADVPWDVPFDTRLAMLTRGTPRAAYFYSTPDTSTFRYRAYNMAQALSVGPGASASWFSKADMDGMGRVLAACDVLILCRNTLYDNAVARLAAQARARGVRLLFDVDDLVFDPSYTHLLMDTLGVDMTNSVVWDYWYAYVGRVGATFALCDGALVTNPTLGAHAARWSGKPARTVPNFLNRQQQHVSAQVWQAKDDTGWARDGRLHIAYFSGSPSHNRDFALAAPAIAALMDEDPTIWLRVVGFLDAEPSLARHSDRIESLPLQDFQNLQREMGAVEVNIVPLQENPFTHCKSELKWFEAAIVGSLTLASPSHAYTGAIVHGENGWLVPSHGWKAALRQAVATVQAGAAAVLPRARTDALTRFGFDQQRATIEQAVFG